MNRIHYSPEAQNDLLTIKEYIGVELLNPSAAKNTVAKITKKIRGLKQYPEMGIPLSSITNIDTNHRFFPCGNYLVFYHVIMKNIYIDRVLYGKRDYITILFGDMLTDG